MLTFAPPSKHPLVVAAFEHVNSLHDKPNRFGLGKIVLNSSGAHTSCSTYKIALITRTYDVDADTIKELFGDRYPRARQFQRAYSAGKLPQVTTISEILPGTLGAIGYDDDRLGMSGHCFVAVGKPVATGAVWGAHKEYSLRVVDSCRTSHGENDTRWTPTGSKGGIGIGNMRLLANEDGVVVAHSWSVSFDSELVYNGDGLELAFANVPSNWRAK